MMFFLKTSKTFHLIENSIYRKPKLAKDFQNKKIINFLEFLVTKLL